MTCESALQQLHDYVDDELEASARQAVSTHLATCVRCRQEEAAIRDLVTLASRLPSPVAPDRWDEVRSRLGTRQARPRRGRIAQLALAAVVLVAVSSTATWWLQTASVAPAGEDLAIVNLKAAIVQLEGAMAQKDELDPEVQRLVEQNMAIIDRAIEETIEALNAQPSNQRLHKNLAQLHQQKVAVLQRILNS